MIHTKWKVATVAAFLKIQFNRSAISMHEAFQQLLSQYTIDRRLVEPIKRQLEYTYTNLTESNADNKKALEMRLSEIEKKIEKVQERYALGEIERPVFEKVNGKFKEEKDQIELEMGKGQKKLSNPNELIDFTVKLSTSPYEIWNNGNFTQKQNFQKMLFPEGILYDKKNNNYRTTNANSVWEIPQQVFKFFSSYSFDHSAKVINL